MSIPGARCETAAQLRAPLPFHSPARLIVYCLATDSQPDPVVERHRASLLGARIGGGRWLSTF